jgi:hypothetical protein
LARQERGIQSICETRRTQGQWRMEENRVGHRRVVVVDGKRLTSTHSGSGAQSRRRTRQPSTGIARWCTRASGWRWGKRGPTPILERGRDDACRMRQWSSVAARVERACALTVWLLARGVEGGAGGRVTRMLVLVVGVAVDVQP